MSASMSEVKEIIMECKDSEFVLIVSDKFDYSIYGVGCSGKDFEEVYKHYISAPMSSVMEVYDLSMDIDKQLHERRAFHYPEGFKK